LPICRRLTYESAHTKMGKFLELVDNPSAKGPPEAKHKPLLSCFMPEKKMTWGMDAPLEKVHTPSCLILVRI